MSLQMFAKRKLE